MQSYLSLVREILDHGEERHDRTGVGTLSIFGTQTRYDLREGFPLLTTKKVLFKGILHELLWFLRGSTNIHDGLAEHTPIWNAWADEDGGLGPIYGHQWRNWGGHPQEAPGERQGVDQIAAAVNLIKTQPHSRRILVNAWNVADLPHMKLPPCHLLFQFYVAGNRLDCQLYQRSADVALGVPFNIASYALLLTMMAQECGLEPGVFVHTIGDAHLYLNHLDGIREQLERKPLPLPKLEVAQKPMAELGPEDFQIHGYEHHPFIRFEVAV
jgi:thymidylate synthase